MGKGDIKTKRGKIVRGSYGVLRPRKSKETISNNKKEKKSVKVKSPDIIAPIDNIPKKEREVIITEAKGVKAEVLKAEKEVIAKVVKAEKEIKAKVVKAKKEIKAKTSKPKVESKTPKSKAPKPKAETKITETKAEVKTPKAKAEVKTAKQKDIYQEKSELSINIDELKEKVIKLLSDKNLAKPNIRLNALNKLVEILKSDFETIYNKPLLLLKIEKNEFKEKVSQIKKLNSAESSIINNFYKILENIVKGIN
ncbi:MAG: 30S ribosomal protein THX [Bacteroidales bacterium]|nr:30S ribosomal protein THX [Bacteroidales bacterium]